jgi:NAD(P)-dependent dehydrogenase (short-subunit alcohol dehydrogenase family)
VIQGRSAPISGAFVTGGARGLGRAIATALARSGDAVTIADLDAELAAATAAELSSEGLRATSVGLDVGDVAALGAAVAAADAETPLRTLVNNAGIGFSAPLVDVTPEQFDRLMSVNLRAAFFGIQAAARVMLPRGSGSIVNLASTSGFTASTTPMVPYDTSKGAVRMLTVSAARELAGSGIRVNAVAPGTIDTELTRSLATDDGALERLIRRRIPLGRLGAPEDIAEAVVWLSSESAGYVTGHTLVVDGGWLT